jgi:RNA polymerase sigma factor (sigma-70 family)
MSIFENDRDLLDRFRRGDRAALAAVYERYVDEVATLARRGFTLESQGHVYVAGLDADGERELVQETFVKAFSEEARTSFDGLRPYRPFLLRVTKNLMIDRFRARRKEGLREEGGGIGDIEELLEADGDLEARPEREEDLHWKKLSAATSEFLAGVDRESRELVRLRFEEELSQDTVAEQLGCSRRRVRTVESRLQKLLLRHLRRLGMIDS